MAPAERADVIVDFTNVPVGTEITLLNHGPDEPFGGGSRRRLRSHPDTTGQVMQFGWRPAVVRRHRPPRRSTCSCRRQRPGRADRDARCVAQRGGVRQRQVPEDGLRQHRVWTAQPARSFGPTAALLGTVNSRRSRGTRCCGAIRSPRTRPSGRPEIWEIHNFTADAHPIHVHLVQFQVVDRQALAPVDAVGRGGSHPPCDRVAETAGGLGNGLQGHRHRLSRRDHPHQGTFRLAGLLRLALPHRRARGQRDDAALPRRADPAGRAGAVTERG